MVFHGLLQVILVSWENVLRGIDWEDNGGEAHPQKKPAAEPLEKVADKPIGALLMARHLEPADSKPGVGLSFCSAALHKESLNVLEPRLGLLAHV